MLETEVHQIPETPSKYFRNNTTIIWEHELKLN